MYHKSYYELKSLFKRFYCIIKIVSSECVLSLCIYLYYMDFIYKKFYTLL